MYVQCTYISYPILWHSSFFQLITLYCWCLLRMCLPILCLFLLWLSTLYLSSLYLSNWFLLQLLCSGLCHYSMYLLLVSESTYLYIIIFILTYRSWYATTQVDTKWVVEGKVKRVREQEEPNSITDVTNCGIGNRTWKFFYNSCKIISSTTGTPLIKQYLEYFSVWQCNCN